MEGISYCKTCSRGRPDHSERTKVSARAVGTRTRTHELMAAAQHGYVVPEEIGGEWVTMDLLLLYEDYLLTLGCSIVSNSRDGNKRVKSHELKVGLWNARYPSTHTILIQPILTNLNPNLNPNVNPNFTLTPTY
jgi:hypothetical protein